MTTKQQAIMQVLKAGGFNTLADNVQRDVRNGPAAIQMAMNMSSGDTKNALLKAAKLVGKPSLDVRHYVETGKRRNVIY